VKVPEQDFAVMMRKISKVGTVVSKNVSSEDITDQVADATNGERTLVDQKGTLTDDIHNGNLSQQRIENKEADLQDVTSQLADTKSRLKGLRKMAAMATIEVSLTQPAKVVATPIPQSPFWSGMRESNRSAMLAFQSAIRVPLLLVIWAIALGPIWVPLVIAARYYMRKAR